MNKNGSHIMAKKINKGDWGRSHGTRGTPAMEYLTEILQRGDKPTPADWEKIKRMSDEYWKEVVVPVLMKEKIVRKKI
jgi:hypothetical protein